MEIFMMDHKTHGITVIRLFDGCFVGHEIDCLSTVNEKQFLSDLSLAKQWLLKELTRHTMLSSSEEAEEI